MIDFHSHILPHMDDGSKTVDMSLRMLRLAKAQGVTTQVLTSHYYADQEAPAHYLQRRAQAFRQMAERHEQDLPSVVLAAEVAYFDGISRMSHLEHLCVEGTRLLLLEMPFEVWSKDELQEVQSLQKRGLVPVIAHLDRYLPIRGNRPWMQALQALAVPVQINADALLHFFQKRTVLKWFQAETAHILGSDAHDLQHRPCRYQAARAVLEQQLTPMQLQKMDAFAEKLLQGAVRRTLS